MWLREASAVQQLCRTSIKAMKSLTAPSLHSLSSLRFCSQFVSSKCRRGWLIENGDRRLFCSPAKEVSLILNNISQAEALSRSGESFSWNTVAPGKFQLLGNS